jgi:hypothetical protein
MDEPQEPDATPEDLATGRVAPRWPEVIEDMHATAAEYAEAGWETVQLHPGDVTVLDGGTADGRAGLDLVVPGDEFERLTEAVADRSFGSADVFRNTAGGIVFLMAVLTDTQAEVAVFVPAYYEVTDAETLRSIAAAEGAVTTHVRQLRNERRVEFEHEEPELFLPDGES